MKSTEREVKMVLKKDKRQPDFLADIADHLKPFNTATDLVKLGISNSVKSLANKRYSGDGPDFIRIKGTGVRYPKESVLRWLKDSSVYVACQKRC
jgi:hypothetical protein